MKIIEKSISKITPYERNPRINDQAVEAVAESIREFGFKVPIIIDRDGVIVAGHTRLKAAKALGMEKVPCIIADDLTEEQVRAFRLADNKAAELSEWDFDLLPEELARITGIDMSVFGFDTTEPEDPDEVVEDEFDTGKTETHGVRPGQVWQCGEHKVMCGDATSRNDAKILMGGRRQTWSARIHHTTWRSGLICARAKRRQGTGEKTVS